MATNDPTTRTECEGCFDEGCAVCEPWHSQPSKRHARLISAPSEKQLKFFNDLLSTRKLPARLVHDIDQAVADGLDKSTCSKFIDELLPLPLKDGKTGASEAQVRFLRNLVEQHDCGITDLDALLPNIASKAAASQLIDAIKATPKRSTRQPASPGRGWVELEDGIYKDGDRIVKVYVTVHGAHEKVGKTWDPETRSFEYGGKRALRGLTPEHKMTLAEAVEFGSIYGICCNCSRTLIDERSIEAGIGPVCAKRFA